MTQIVAREFIDNTECEIIHLEKPLKLLYLTMAVTKDSPYRAAFNYQLVEKMRRKISIICIIIVRIICTFFSVYEK